MVGDSYPSALLTGSDVTEEPIVFSAVEAGIGLTGVRTGPGRAEFRAPLAPGALGPDGGLSPTLLSVAADAAVATAVFAHPAGSPTGVTVELRVDRLAPVAPEARHLDVTAVALGVTDGFGSGRAEFRDERGTLIAHAVGVMVGDTDGRAPLGSGGEVAYPPMDPEIVRIRPLMDGSARVDVSVGMLNSRGMLHGGILMALAQLAQEHCHLTAGAVPRPLRLDVCYLRPAPGEDSLHFRSEYVRRGRRLWTLRTEVLRSDGAIAAIATGTGAISAAPVRA